MNFRNYLFIFLPFVLLGCFSIPKTYSSLLQLEGKEVMLKRTMDLHQAYADKDGNPVGWFINDDGTINTEEVDYPYTIGFFANKTSGPLLESFKPVYYLEETRLRPEYKPGKDHSYSTRAYWELKSGTRLMILKVKNNWGLDSGDRVYVYGKVVRPDNKETVYFKFHVFGKVLNLPWQNDYGQL